jgi:hypothetical protein
VVNLEPTLRGRLLHAVPRDAVPSPRTPILVCSSLGPVTPAPWYSGGPPVVRPVTGG